MKKSPPPGSDGAAPPRSALDWPRESGLGPDLARAIRAEVARRRRQRFRVATATACALLLGVFVAQRSDVFAPAVPAAIASSRVSAPERRTLPDGSVVELKNGATIEVNFTPALRRVVLTRGEAHFEVAKNPARPFVVTADGVEVRAVGTAFAVERGGDTVEVLVTEGRVTVARESAAPSAPTSLTAGNRAVIAASAESAPAPDVTALSASEIARRLAWRVPRLEFSGAPLAEVVRLFVEHGRVRLALGEPALGAVKVSGVLRADNVDALLQLLAADHAIEADVTGAGIVLRRRR
jgi:transmembrane sensor